MADKQRGAAKGREQHPSVQGAEPDQPNADPGVEAASKHSVGHPAGSQDAGPGTKREAPEDETVRGQQRMHIGAGHVAAPIEAPDGAYQTDPEEGHSRSSSNPIGGLVGVQTYTGENHVNLVGEDGEEIAAGDLFEAHEENQTYRVVKDSVYEVFNYAGSLQPMSRRLFYKGQRVDLTTAARVADAQRLGQAQLAQEKARIEAEERGFFAVTPDKA